MNRRKLPHPYQAGDAEYLARRVAELTELPRIPPVSDEEVIESIERMVGRRIHDRRAVIAGVRQLADVVVMATIPPIS